MINLTKKLSFILVFILFVAFFFTVEGHLFTQEETDPYLNPLKEGTYTIMYYQDFIKKRMAGSNIIEEGDLHKFQRYYIFYCGKSGYSSKLMIELYERDSSGKNSILIQRFRLNNMGNIVFEQIFNTDRKLKSYTLYEYDDLGRLLREVKYHANGKVNTEKKMSYNTNGNLRMKQIYSRGKLVQKEIYGEKNKVQKKSKYYYFPDGSFEKIEEFGENDVIKKTVIYDYDGSVLQKIYYKAGEIDRVVNTKPTDKEEEPSPNTSGRLSENKSNTNNSGTGPNILVINDIFTKVEEIMNTESDEFVVSGKTYAKTSADFMFGVFKWAGIDLERIIIEYSKEKGLKNVFKEGKVHDLFYYLNSKKCVEIPTSKTKLEVGDLLFFNYILDTNGDWKFDKYSHIGIVNEVKSDGTATFYHCLSFHGGIQIGSINLKKPNTSGKNSILKVVNEKYLTSHVVSGVAKLDYLGLKAGFRY